MLIELKGQSHEIFLSGFFTNQLLLVPLTFNVTPRYPIAPGSCDSTVFYAPEIRASAESYTPESRASEKSKYSLMSYAPESHDSAEFFALESHNSLVS